MKGIIYYSFIIVPGDCFAPPMPGPCRQRIPRWYYNTEKNICEQFTYGGCGGNGNNFETKEECERFCMRK